MGLTSTKIIKVEYFLNHFSDANFLLSESDHKIKFGFKWSVSSLFLRVFSAFTAAVITTDHWPALLLLLLYALNFESSYRLRRPCSVSTEKAGRAAAAGDDPCTVARQGERCFIGSIISIGTSVSDAGTVAHAESTVPSIRSSSASLWQSPRRRRLAAAALTDWHVEN